MSSLIAERPSTTPIPRCACASRAMCSRFSLGWSKNPPYRPMLPANQTLADLRARFAHTGRLEWIGVRPERGRIESVTQAELAPERGLLGDHRAAQVGGKRQITLIQFEHLGVIAALCGREVVSPALLRRNLAVSSISWLCTTGLFASVRHGAKAAVYATPARAWRKLWGKAAITQCAGTVASPPVCSKAGWYR